MQQQASAWLDAAGTWIKKKRPSIHRLIVVSLIAPIFTTVVPVSPAVADLSRGNVLSLDAGNYVSGSTITNTGSAGNLLLQGSPVVGFSSNSNDRFTFDGSSQYITSTNGIAYTTTTNYSIGIWFRATSASNGKKLIGLENTQTGTGATSYDKHLFFNSSGNLVFGNYTTVVKEVASSAVLTDNIWHYAVATFNGSTAILYVDGVLQNSISTTSQAYTGYWKIGGYKATSWTGGSDGYFTGDVATADVYTSVLDQATITENYVSTVSYLINNSNILRQIVRYDSKNSASWSGSGSTWNDISGNSRNVTLNNSLTTSSQSVGSYNIRAMQFNSSAANASLASSNTTGKYGTINSNFSFDYSAGFSIGFYADFGGSSQAWERIVDIGNGSNAQNILVAREGTTSNLVMEIYNGSATAGQCKAMGGIDAAGTWAHWAIVLNGSTCTFYKNGSLFTGSNAVYNAATAAYSATGSVAYTGLPTSNVARTNAWIGRSNWGTDGYFEGGIADIAMYNKALSAQEVMTLRNSQISTTIDAGTGVCTNRVSDPTGVTVASVGSDCVLSFAAPSNTSRTTRWTVPSDVVAARVLVVGGGGGGGSHVGGGGGAGGFLETTTTLSPISVVTISTGAGGVGSSQLLSASPTAPGSGANSSFGSSLTAVGGGNGAVWTAYANSTGGSGGGGTAYGGSWPNGAATSNASQGNAGGGGSTCGSGYGYPTGGGGGAGGAGGTGICPAYSAGKSGDGGIGKQSDITGSSVYYAGGGGGGGHNQGSYAIFAGKGGIGGGGDGNAFANGTINGTCSGVTVSATQGTDGLGGGGGGAGAPWSNLCNSNGGRGGSGIVIVRYGTTTLSISANNGTGFTGTTSFTGSTYTTITLPSASGISRAGYTFAGWNTASNGSGTSYAAGSTYQLAGTRTLFAQWNSVLSYNANGPTISRVIETTTALGSEASTTLNNGSALSRGMVTSGLDLYLDASNSRSYPGTGTTWFDISGNGRNATAVNSPTFDSANGAFNFNGTTQYFDLGNTSLNYQGTQAYTFGAWIKTTAASKSEQCIICRYNAGGSFLFRLINKQVEHYRTGQGVYQYTGLTLTTGNNYYVATTYDGTNVNIFVNGVRVYSAASGSMSFTSTINTFIGKSVENYDRYFQGQIGVVQAYNFALTDGQILQNYNALLNKSIEAELPSTPGSKAGYTFTGWASSSDTAAAITSGTYATGLNAVPTPYIRLKATDYDGSNWTPTNYVGAGISYLDAVRPTLRTNQTGWGTSATFSSVYGLSGKPMKLGNVELPAYTFCAMAKWPVNGVTLPSSSGRMFTGTNVNWLDGWYYTNVGDTHHTSWNYDGSYNDFNWHYYCDTGNDIYLDGVKIISTYQSYQTLPTLSIGGGYWNGSGWYDYTDYEFSELIIYDKVLSADQLDYIHRYFKNTYGFEYGSTAAPSASLLPGGNFSSPGNSTLYAVWGSTITYDGNGATSGTAPATQVFQRTTGTLATNTGNLSLRGRNFSGWNTKADGTGTFYAAGASYTGPDVTLYAVYKAPVKFTNTMAGADPITLSPYMRFKASDYNATQRIWYDSSGNGRDTSYVRGSPSIVTTTANQNGSTKSFTTLQGTTADGFQFKNPTMNSGAWTIFSMARLNGSQTGNARIFDGEAGNFLFGFYQNNSGVAHYNGWITSNANTYGTNWVASTGYTDYYRAAGVRSSDSIFTRLNATANMTDTLQQLTINAGQYIGSDVANWQVAELLIFDRQLSASEMQQVEDYLTNTYGLTNATTQNTYLAPAVVNVAAGSTVISDTFTAVLGFNNQFTLSPTIPGITLNANANSVSITVASTVAVGTYYETITATDFSGSSAQLPIQINVVNPIVWAAGNPSGVVTTFGKSTRTRLDLSGGFGTRVAEIAHLSSPAPRGVTIDTSTVASGYITLVTDTGTAPGTYSESITVTDGSKIRRTLLLTITINAPPDISYSALTDSEYPILTNNLYLNYDFANPSSYPGSGTTLTDLRGNGISGTVSNGTPFGNGAGGNFSLNGTNRVTIQSPVLSNTQTFSKFVWFYPTSATGSIIDVCDNAACSSYHESELEMSSSVLYARVWNAAAVNSGSNTVSLNQWHYVGYSWEYVSSSVTNVKIYLDGKIVGSATQSNGRSAPTVGQFDLFSVGDTTYMATSANGTFLMGAFHLYRSVLTPEQVQQNFQNTKPRYLGLSAASPTYSGNVSLSATEGKSSTFQVFAETGGTGVNTFALSGTNSTFSLGSVATDQTSLIVGSATTATNATTAKTYYETLTATDSASAATAYYLTITVNPKIAITATTDTVTTTFGKIAYDTITASYGTGTLTFTRTSSSGSSAITAPVTGNQALLTLSSTLPVGTYYETFTVTDSVSATSIKVIQIIVNPALTLTSATGVNQIETTFGRAASLTINAANGTGTRTASALPVTISGVSLTSTNLQNGTMTLALTNAVAIGRYTETITVTDATGATASLVITIIVNAAPTIAYGGATSGALNFVTTKGGSLQTNAFTVANGTGTKVLTLSGLNSGITIDTSTANSGILTFGPSLNSTDTQTSRIYYETITVTDSASATATRALTVIVNPAIIETTTSTTISTTSGLETSTVIYASKGTGPITFSRTGTSVSGITLTSSGNQATLRVLSTINPGTYYETVTATDTASATTSLMFTIVVAPPPSITGQTRMESTKGVTAKSSLFAISGGTGTLAMTLTNSPSNPRIILTGTSSSGGYLYVDSTSETGTYTSTIRVTDARGSFSQIVVTVVVNAPVTLSGTFSITKTYGTSTSNGYTTNGSGTAPFAFSATPVCATVKGVSGNITTEQINGTDSCTWTAPVGVTSFDALIVGGGGGGGGDGGSGGGGGSINVLSGVSVPASRQLGIQVGAGGTGGVWGGSSATGGGTSSIVSGATTYTAPGGSGGGGCGAAATPGGVRGSGGSTVAGASGGAGASGACSAGSGSAGSGGYSPNFLGNQDTYGGGGAGGPYPDSVSSMGGSSGGTGGGGNGAISKGFGSYGLPTYFRALGSTPNAASNQDAFTSGLCGSVTGNFNYTGDADFPCSQKDNFQGYATGFFVAPYTGSITFCLYSDDSSYLNINGQTLNKSGASTTWTCSSAISGFTNGVAYPISAYFTEMTGAASWKIGYTYGTVGSTTSPVIIPISQFRSGSTGLAQYFNAVGSTPPLATTKPRLTSSSTNDCMERVGNINFTADADFPCATKDNFQGYATGWFVSPYTGDITFSMLSDDSSDLEIEVNGVTNELQRPCCGESSVTWSGFVQGQYYPIRVYFAEVGGVAQWTLSYTYGSQAKTIIPVDNFRSMIEFTQPTAGTNGQGGGGGAGSAGLHKLPGARGGSGTVIIRYTTQSDTATETMITAYVNQVTPSGLLTLNIPSYVTVGTYFETITVQDSVNSAPYSATVMITINKATPTATIALPGGVTTAQYGTPVLLTVNATAPGNVAFKRAGSAITGCSSVATSNGVATCLWTPTAVETTTVSALLSPTDSVNFNNSVETATSMIVTVGRADSLTVTANSPTAITYSPTMTMPTNGFTTIGLRAIDSITAMSYTYSTTGGGTTCATGGTCAVGDTGPAGGVVIYVSGTTINSASGISSGGLYLEAAPAPYSTTTYNWCEGGANPYTTTINASGTAVGTGADNTRIMLANCTGGAGYVAANLTLAGYSDWFLPSSGELALMSTYKSQIGLNNSSLYWGSTESSNWVAASLVTSNGGVGGQNKGQATPLWPIRAFSPGGQTLSGSPTNAGTYTITPSAASFNPGAASNYQSIQYVSGTLVINRAPRGTWSASYASGSNLTRYGAGKTETATVTYPGDGVRTFSTSSSVCSVDASSGTLTTLGVGTCSIQVVLSQTTNWLSDTKTVTVTIDRGLRTATITPALSTIKYGDTTTVTSTISPALDSATVTYSANGTVGCLVDNVTGLVTGIKALTACTVRVTYDRTDLYESATATASITVNRANAPVITTDSITAVSYTGATAIVTPTYKVTGILARDISQILPTADVSSSSAIAAIAASSYSQVASFRYFATNPTNYDSTTAPTLGGTYSVTAQGLTLRGGLDIANYETPTAVSSNLVINPIAQTPLVIKLSYLESVTVPYDVVTTGGSSTGARTLTVLAGGTATGCAVDLATSAMRLKSSSAGTCIIRVTQAADRNYLVATSDSQTVNILNFVVNILQLFSNPTGISINSYVPFTKGPDVCTSNCRPTITQITDMNGTTVTSIAANTPFRIIGTNFNTTTSVQFSAMIGTEDIFGEDADSFQIDSDTQLTVMPPAILVPAPGQSATATTVLIHVRASGGLSSPNMSITSVTL